MTFTKGKYTDGRFTVEPPTASAVTSTQPRHTAPLPNPHIPSPEGHPVAATPLLGTENTATDPPAQLHESKLLTNGTNSHTRKAMFGTSIGNSANRRRAMANTNALTKYEADLTDQDRAKQKEAVRRYLVERVKSDWKWQWPQPEAPPSSHHGSTSADASELVENTYDSIEEQWKERDEWLSNNSEEEGAAPAAVAGTRQDSPSARDDPFCFGSPESIGTAIRKHEMERKRRRKKRLAEEMVYNDGLRCFVQRRDAWTGARQVGPSSDNGLTRARTKRSSIYSLLPGKSSPADAELDSDTGLSRTRTKRSSIYSILPGRGAPLTESEPEADSEWDRATEIPIAAPILPPENAMRASITPAAYNTIYDKVVLQQLTPSCPMNLKDVTRSCVQGWKRDGEWPPKSSTEPAKKKGRRLSFVSLFSLEKNEEKGKGENEAEQAKERLETPRDESHEKTSKRPTAAIGKGIRKMMFWKEKHDSHGSGGGPNGHGQGRMSPAV